MAEGAKLRQRHEIETVALAACWVVNNAGMRSGRALKPTDLVPEIIDKPKVVKTTAEDNKAELEAIFAAFGDAE